MDFPGPDPADIVHVQTLNQAFIAHIGSTGGARLRATLPEPLAARLKRLDAAARDRIARTPFLLASIDEVGTDRWDRLLAASGPPDLVDRLDGPPAAEQRLVCALLGFLGDLARRNAYAARVVSGASLGWCERVAELSPIERVDIAAAGSGLLAFRYGRNTRFWQRLLSAGASAEDGIRRAARIWALQAVLTRGESAAAGCLPAAACAMAPPPRRVGDRAGVSQPEARGYNTPPDARTDDQKPPEDLPER